MPEDDVPPENIWHDSKRIEEWFEAVKARRESGMQPIDEPEDTPMLSNEETAKLIGG